MAQYLALALVSLGQGPFEMRDLEMTLFFFVLITYVGIMVGFLLLPPLPFGEEELTRFLSTLSSPLLKLPH